jgi:hypothetical protein
MKKTLDEMYDGYDIDLQKQGYEAYSIRKLRTEGKRLRSDYSVIKYADENHMTLITADTENGLACEENGISCVLLDKDEIVKVMLEKLKKLDST